MKGFIYLVTNKVNNKKYVGQTRYSPEFRWKQHIYKNDGSYFHNAIQKYGPDNFKLETLEECDINLLDEKEIFYISKYDTFDNGYNLTIGGDGKRKIVSDSQYEEIKGLYLSGFSCYKIASLFNVDKTTILKILKIMGVKIRNNQLNINRQELEELILDYNTGYSLKELAKRYNCSASGLKEFLIKKGVDVRNKYSILDDIDAQLELINDYLTGDLKLSDIQLKYHCSYYTLKKILSIHNINEGKKHRKLKSKEINKIIDEYNNGASITELSKIFHINRTTIYKALKEKNVFKLSNDIITPRVSTS